MWSDISQELLFKKIFLPWNGVDRQMMDQYRAIVQNRIESFDTLRSAAYKIDATFNDTF